MSEYSKALLSEDTEYGSQEDPSAEHPRIVALAILSVCVDAALSLALLSFSLPFSLPLWPLIGAIFLSAFYAFRRHKPTAFRPLLILLVLIITHVPIFDQSLPLPIPSIFFQMFALVVCPSLFVFLAVSSVRDPSHAVQLLSAFIPFIPAEVSPFSVLLPVCFLLLCSSMSFYWQLHTFWRFQQKFEQKKRWDCSNGKEYAELFVSNPFANCRAKVADEKQPLKQKRMEEAERSGKEVKGSSVPSTRVTVSEVLPDYQVFSLNEDEPKKQQRGVGQKEEGQQRTQKWQKGADGQIIRSSG